MSNANPVTDPWAAVAEAQAYAKDYAFNVPGKYLVLLLKGASKTDRLGNLIAVFETKVIKGPAYVGEKVSYAKKRKMMEKPLAMFNREIKLWVAILGGIAPDQVTADIIKQVMVEGAADGTYLWLDVETSLGDNGVTYFNVTPVRKAEGAEIPV